jgi:hypothetical protein
MPELPRRKVGIVSCSGEELPEGTITRLATLKVLEALRPEDTVTICLPLFLAGGEADRAFARFHPTIAVDGCEKRCAARGTAMHSGAPAATLVVTDLLTPDHAPLGTARRLSDAGMHAIETVATEMAHQVDRILRPTRRRSDERDDPETSGAPESVVATCSCGSGIPVQTVVISGEEVTVVALPLILDQFRSEGRLPSERTSADLMEAVRIYNLIPPGEEGAWVQALAREYAAFCSEV